VKTLIRKYAPNEIILNESSFVRGLKEFINASDIYYNFLSDIRFNINYANEILKKQFGFKGKELGLDEVYSIISSGALLFYIYKLQKLDLSHINKINYVNLKSNMVLDSVSLRNLEVVSSIFSKNHKHTLFGLLNNTKTSAGARLFKKQLISPLLNLKEIEARLDSVEELNGQIMERGELRDLLDEFNDIERITSRITSGIVSPKDIYALKLSLEKLPEIKSLTRLFQTELLKDISKIDILESIVDELERAIVPNAASHTRDIGYLKKDYDEKLGELFELAFNSKGYLKELEEDERLKTGNCYFED